MNSDQEEIPLSKPMRRAWLEKDERSAVFRRGDVVVRDVGPWASSVHSLLNHLENAGFKAAPRLVGTGFDGDGRETLDYIEGEVLHPAPWSSDGAARVGTLIRQLHDAVAGFVPPKDAMWPPWFGREVGSSRRIISHCDLAPWNIVSRSGMPIAFIDWELAGPVDPVVDLAHAAWLNVNLHGDDERFLPFNERVQQLRALVDGYALPINRRSDLVRLMIEVAVHDTAFQADEASVTSDSEDTDALWGMAWRARAASWLLHRRNEIEKALI